LYRYQHKWGRQAKHILPAELKKNLFNFSVEMLSDEQVASLMLEDLDEDPLLGLPVGQTIQASSRPPSALSKAA
jgi:hypothetical protein